MLRKIFSMKLGQLFAPKTHTNSEHKEIPLSDDESIELRMLAFLRTRIDPADFSTTENEIRTEFRLYQRRYDNTSSSAKLAEDLQFLATNSDLSSVFLFHGDGRVREAALGLMKGPIEIPVVMYGLVARLNDWVPSVRLAAKLAFDRCLPVTSADKLTPAVWQLILNAGRWRRWSDGYSKLLRSVAERQDLIEALAERVASDRTGGTGMVLRTISQSQHIDVFLEPLAANAAQPHIRALALSYLSARRVWWPLGTLKKVWIDKSMGDFRVVPDFGSRPISVEVDLVEIIARSVRDRSTIVRREALDAIAKHRSNVSFQVLMSETVSMLTDDPNPSIRSRLEFLQNAVRVNH